MEPVLLALVVLACPLGMGLCMWMMARMMRGMNDHGRKQPEQAVAAAAEQSPAAPAEGATTQPSTGA